MASNQEDALVPIGESVQGWEHTADHGTLIVIDHAVIHSIIIEVYRCSVCDRTFDVANDYELIGPIEIKPDGS